MKRIIYLFLFIFLAVSCQEDGLKPTTDIKSDLKKGEYLIKLYNEDGVMLFENEGTAQLVGRTYGRFEIRLLYPEMVSQSSDPDQYASLTFFRSTMIDEPGKLPINADNTAMFHQRWYSMPDDWGYEGKDGSLTITKIRGDYVEGYFRIKLSVDQFSQQNARWGDNVIAEGKFSTEPL